MNTQVPDFVHPHDITTVQGGQIRTQAMLLYSADDDDFTLNYLLAEWKQQKLSYQQAFCQVIIVTCRQFV